MRVIIFIDLHPEFVDEGIFWNLDLEMNFFGLIESVRHTACDNCDGIAAVYSRIDVEAVDVNISFLC